MTARRFQTAVPWDLTRGAFMRTQTDNLFLSSLTAESRQSLLAHAVAVGLPLSTVLYEAQEAPPLCLPHHFRYGISRDLDGLWRDRGGWGRRS